MFKERIIYPYFRSNGWAEAWASPRFRTKTIVAMIVFVGIMVLLPHFFAFIEARTGGLLMEDWLLQNIPAHDCSVTIFIFLWSTTLLAMVRCIQQPAIFLRIIYVLIALTLTRVSTIYLFSLEPPAGIIHLKDPLTSLTYGGRELFITKDLFFSGHTSNLFLISLCLQKKRDKQFALLATIVVATLILVQHVHYSIDVIMAFVFTYILVAASRQMRFFDV